MNHKLIQQKYRSIIPVHFDTKFSNIEHQDNVFIAIQKTWVKTRDYIRTQKQRNMLWLKLDVTRSLYNLDEKRNETRRLLRSKCRHLVICAKSFLAYSLNERFDVVV